MKILNQLRAKLNKNSNDEKLSSSKGIVELCNEDSGYKPSHMAVSFPERFESSESDTEKKQDDANINADKLEKVIAGILKDPDSLARILQTRSERKVALVALDEDQDRIMRMYEVMKITGFSRQHIYNLMEQGKFPKSFKLIEGGRAAGWHKSVITAWVEERDKNQKLMA